MSEGFEQGKKWNLREVRELERAGWADSQGIANFWRNYGVPITQKTIDRYISQLQTGSDDFRAFRGSKENMPTLVSPEVQREIGTHLLSEDRQALMNQYYDAAKVTEIIENTKRGIEELERRSARY